MSKKENNKTKTQSKVQKFVEEALMVQNVLYNPNLTMQDTKNKIAKENGQPLQYFNVDKKPEIEESTYEQYLSESNKNRLIIGKYLQKYGAISLLISPTGSGKTYFYFESFKLFNFTDRLSNTKVVNILVVPNKVQAIQSGIDYGKKFDIIPIHGGTKGFKDYDLAYKNFCVVYDRLHELLEALKMDENKDVKVRLIVDECHNCLMAQYRSQCLSEMDEVIDYVVSNDGVVNYVTATYQCMHYLKVDYILAFEQKGGYKPKAKKLVIYRNKSKKSVVDFNYNLLKDKKALVRYNNKNVIKDLITKLYLLGRESLYVNSDEKDYIEVNDNVKYINELLDALVSKGNIPQIEVEQPDLLDDGSNMKVLVDICYAFCTSLLDCGTNIKTFAGREDETFEAFFAVLSQDDLSILNIIQLFNRIRYKVNQWSLSLKYQEPKKGMKFKELHTVMYFEKLRLENRLIMFRETLKAIKLYYNKEMSGESQELINEKIRKEMESRFEDTCIDRNRNDENCIYLTADMKINYDSKKFFYNVYNKYNAQYYFFQNKLVERLAEEFNIDVEIVDINDEDIKDSTNAKYVSTVTDVLYDMATNIEKEYLIRDIETGKYNHKETKSIRNTKELQDALSLVRYKLLLNKKYSVKDAFIYLKNNDDKTVQNELDKELKGVIDSLTSEEISELNRVITGELRVIDFKDKSLKNKLGVVKESNYYQYFIKAYKKDMDINKLKSAISESESEYSIEKFFNNNQYVDNNRTYIYKDKAMLTDSEQIVILDNLLDGYSMVKDTKTGKNKVITKKIKLTDKILIKIATELNEKFMTKKWTKTTTKNFIKKLFKTRMNDGLVQIEELLLEAPKNKKSK